MTKISLRNSKWLLKKTTNNFKELLVYCDSSTAYFLATLMTILTARPITSENLIVSRSQLFELYFCGYAHVTNELTALIA